MDVEPLLSTVLQMCASVCACVVGFFFRNPEIHHLEQH